MMGEGKKGGGEERGRGKKGGRGRKGGGEEREGDVPHWQKTRGSGMRVSLKAIPAL